MLAGADLFSIPFDVPPYRLSGAVYGTLLNHRSALAALGQAVHQPPYHSPPNAPVLYIKPRNTLARSGDIVRIPAGTPELEVGACLGMVIGRTACKVSEPRALDYVAGYLIVADVAWLANRIAPYGEELRTGDIILAGSFTRPTNVVRGDALHADYGALGGISMRFV
jgi:hypothetical protein